MTHSPAHAPFAANLHVGVLWCIRPTALGTQLGELLHIRREQRRVVLLHGRQHEEECADGPRLCPGVSQPLKLAYEHLVGIFVIITSCS